MKTNLQDIGGVGYGAGQAPRQHGAGDVLHVRIGSFNLRRFHNFNSTLLKTRLEMQWVENNLTNIRIFCTDICFSPHGTTLMALLKMSVYGCSLMLDGLVSSHQLEMG